MKCEIFRSNNKIAGPITYDVSTVAAIIHRQGGDARPLPTRLMNAVTIGTIVIRPVIETRPPLGPGQYHAQERVRVTDNHVEYIYQAKMYELNRYRQILTDKLSQVHDQYENERFEYRGILIKQDLEARTNALGALSMLESGAITRTDWRGKVEVPHPYIAGQTYLVTQTIPIESAAEMQALMGAVVVNLNKAFAARGMVEQQIQSTTSMSDIDDNGTVIPGLAKLDPRSAFMTALASL